MRYGVLDWAPTYLSEEKHFDLSASGWAYLYEWAGIPARYSVVIYLTNYLKVAVVQQASFYVRRNNLYPYILVKSTRSRMVR